MLVIGLTGGIGSGKSTVARLFSERGIAIIDADVIARDITAPAQPAFTAITKHYGNEILCKNGTLDRAKLRHIIFNDRHERRWLENLLHPLIRGEIEKQTKQVTSPYCIVVIPLLIEVGPYPFINRILVVDTPEHLQIERTALRDKVEKHQVEAILKTQTNRQQRLKYAHDIIINDGKREDLALQVDQLHHRYLKMAQA